jgi:hypothetical protein
VRLVIVSDISLKRHAPAPINSWLRNGWLEA